MNHKKLYAILVSSCLLYHIGIESKTYRARMQEQNTLQTCQKPKQHEGEQDALSACSIARSSRPSECPAVVGPCCCDLQSLVVLIAGLQQAIENLQNRLLRRCNANGYQLLC